MAKDIKLDRNLWKRSLTDILQASEEKLLKMLLQDGLFSSWYGKLCPRCGKGTMSKLQSGVEPRRRCSGSAKGCPVYINPHHLHPLFTDGRGTGRMSLQRQAAPLFLKLNNIPHTAIHRLLGVNHKAIADMATRLRSLRKKYVEVKEKEIDFASGVKWSDVEADETTFDRQNMGAFAENKVAPIAWEQWCGLVKRGAEARAGAIRKVEWTPLANKWLKVART